MPSSSLHGLGGYLIPTAGFCPVERLPSCLGRSWRPLLFPRRKLVKAEFGFLDAAHITCLKLTPLSIPAPAPSPKHSSLKQEGGLGFASENGVEQQEALIRTSCDLCCHRTSDRNVDWAHCIFLGALCDKSDIFATREEMGKGPVARDCSRWERNT